MAKAGYSIVTGGAVALSAATAKSVLGVKSHANFGLDLKKFKVGFDGVTASAVPVLVELCYATFATNSPGTASTSVTPAQIYGRSVTVGATAAKTWTTEPTVLTVVQEWLLSPNGGLVFYDFPLGDTPDSAVSEGFVIRCTAPAIVSVRASMEFERC
ncbi:hypothetical protein [Streptomyces sp.]|uniref:hypothetical protein n=1 Tax=Streptomyces sp. TaxID=1931 RepID=UPI002F955FC9